MSHIVAIKVPYMVTWSRTAGYHAAREPAPQVPRSVDRRIREQAARDLFAQDRERAEQAAQGEFSTRRFAPLSEHQVRIVIDNED
ncbi:MAG: hypothetical protein WD558_05965 [Pseudomonadales bacterium]